MTKPDLKISTLWMMLASLLIGTMIGTMGNSIVSIALPSIMDFYSIPLPSAVLSITLYTLTFSVLIPVFGSLSLRIGFKRLFTSGMLMVIVSSLACIFAPNYTIFLIARILIGIGVATILPTIMGIISRYFPTEIQGKATGYWALINSLGHAIGPSVGGFLTNHFQWQSIFWINIPLGIISIIMALKVFPKDERVANRWFDWQGASAMTVFVFAGMMAINQAAQSGLRSTATLVPLTISIISFVILIMRERRTNAPFLNLSLFSKKDYISSIIPISLQAFTQFGLLVSLPVFLIDANGIEKQFAGLIIMTMTVMMAVTSPIAGRLVDKYSSRWICLAGTLMVGGAALLMFLLHTNSLTLTDWFFLLVCLFIFGTGFGSIQSGSTVAAIQASPREIAGAATGFFHMIRFIMASLGSTVFGILLESTTRNNMTGFYGSFLLIIVLAAITVPFTFWISAQSSQRAAAQAAE